MKRSRFAMIRVATLSIEESSRIIAHDDFSDPLIHAAVTAAAGHELVDSAPQKARAQETMVRYVARMGGRATPYGLFAGTAVVGVGADRRLQIGPSSGHQVRTRIDVAALEKAVRQALDDSDIADLPLQVNPLARTEGQVMRFARPGDATADVMAVKLTPLVGQIVQLLGSKSLRGRELIAALVAWRPTLTADQLAPVVRQITDTGLIERSAALIEPGVEPGERAAELLERIGRTDQAAALRELMESVGGVRPLGPDPAAQWGRAWQRAAEVIPAFADIAEGKRFDLQLEMAAAECQVDEQTIEDLKSAVLRVQRIVGGAAADTDSTDPVHSAAFNMPRFRDAFRARYEDAEVPLLAAVDLESGVLQPVHRQLSRLAIAAGVTAPDLEASASVSPGALSAYRRFAWSGGPVDIMDFPADETLTSRGIAAALLDGHEGRHTAMLVGGVGRSPFALMSRFGLGRDEVSDQFSAQLQQETADGPVHDGNPIRAELVYHPGGRIGNVLVRPRVLEDTIALTGAAGGTIGLDRLTIRLFGDEFQLRDRQSGRVVVVELNTAHNIDFAGLDPVYAVLGRLAGGGGAGWSWGALARLDHLPRVTCGRVIVAPEQWQLTAERVRSICAGGDPGALLRSELGITDGRRWLGAGSFDHILPIDLLSDRSIRAALARTGDGETVRLTELPQAEAPAVTGPDGHHVAEVVVPVGPALRPTIRPPARDCFYDPASGARWVYARYHCGQSSADHVIGRAAVLARRLVDEGVANDWFFVRYAEDGYHVRLRMRAETLAGRERVLAEVSGLGARLREEGLVGRMVIDDYVPEVTRYGGGRNLAHAERLFSASSTQVADFLATRPTEEARLFQAVHDMLAWVGRVHDDPAQQIEFLRNCQGGLQVSFGQHGNRHGKFYRTHRVGLDAYLDEADERPEVAAAVTALLDAVGEAESPVRVLPVFGSCLHMHCNRMFAFDAVRLEFLGYELAIRKIRERGARVPPAREPSAGSSEPDPAAPRRRERTEAYS